MRSGCVPSHFQRGGSSSVGLSGLRRRYVRDEPLQDMIEPHPVAGPHSDLFSMRIDRKSLHQALT